MSVKSSNITLVTVFISLAIFFFALIVGYSLSGSLSYREVIAALIIMIVVMAVLPGRGGLQLGFIYWVGTLGLGYRTAELTPSLRFHPSEIIIWVLFVVIFMQRVALKQKERVLRLPRWILFFIPFWLWGWVMGYLNNKSPDLMFSELKNFVLLIPLFVVVSFVLNDSKQWRPVILSFYAVSAWIAGMGILEYLYPEISTIFPGFISNPLPYETKEGFMRASFSFWGSPVATFVCALAVPLTTVVWQWWDLPRQRLFTLLAFAALIFGIYIGGFRSMWLLTLIAGALWALLRFGIIPGILAALPALALYRFVPEPAQERWQSMMMAVQGHPVDHSAMVRLERSSMGLDAVIKNPLGYGWAGAGWSHSDFVQVAVNLGLIAGLLFLGAYLWSLGRLGLLVTRYDSKNPQRTLALALFLSFVVAGGILLSQGVEVLPQLIIPTWFVWVLVEIFLGQTRGEIQGK